jgi:MFS family permease
MFRLLRRGPFALLWAGATVSATGDAMSWVALVWLVYRQRGQAGDVAALAAAYTAPVALGGLLAGRLLDRFDRRRLLAADNLVRGLAFATVPVAAALGLLSLTHLYLVAACYGLLKMVSLAGFPTLIPAYVDDRDLQRANALEGLSFGISQAAGAALAAVLLPLVGATTLLAVDAASYLGYALCLARLPDGRPPAAAPAGAARGRSLLAVARFVWRTRALRSTTAMFMLFNIGEGALLVFLPVYSQRLGTGVAGYGLLVSAVTVGELAGSLGAGALVTDRLGSRIVAAQLAAAVLLAGLLLQPPLAPTLVLLAAFGAMTTPMTAWAQTLRMRLTPEGLHGRLFALLRTAMQATPPLGAALAAVTLPRGVTPTVTAVVAVMAVPALVAAPGLVRSEVRLPGSPSR